jgi:hypothetical protein
MSTATDVATTVATTGEITEQQQPAVVEKKKRAPSAPKELHPKVQKAIDTLKAKNEKLAQDNKRLKGELQQQKSANSRIRRIPKIPNANAE